MPISRNLVVLPICFKLFAGGVSIRFRGFVFASFVSYFGGFLAFDDPRCVVPYSHRTRVGFLERRRKVLYVDLVGVFLGLRDSGRLAGSRGGYGAIRSARARFKVWGILSAPRVPGMARNRPGSRVPIPALVAELTRTGVLEVRALRSAERGGVFGHPADVSRQSACSVHAQLDMDVLALSTFWTSAHLLKLEAEAFSARLGVPMTAVLPKRAFAADKFLAALSAFCRRVHRFDEPFLRR